MKKKFYTIQEVCKILKVKPAQIQFFEKNFKIKKRNPEEYPSTNQNYHVEEMEILSIIKSLIIDDMYSITGAKKKLKPLIKNYNTKLSILDDLEALNERL